MAQIDYFTIHHLPLVQTKPPKAKFVLVVDVDAANQYCLCFFINSKVNYGSKPESLPCFVDIACAEYEFLSHDSTIACHDIRTIPFSDFPSTSFRQRLSGSLLLQVKIAVQNCPTIREAHRKNLEAVFLRLGI